MKKALKKPYFEKCIECGKMFKSSDKFRMVCFKCTKIEVNKILA